MPLTVAPTPPVRRIRAEAKRIIKKSAPVRLVKQGGFAGFRGVDARTGKATGSLWRGLTKCLDGKLFSSGSLPWFPMTRAPGATKKGKKGLTTKKKGAKKGSSAGRKRGTAVDSQVTRIINGRGAASKRRPYRLTTLALKAMAHLGLTPLMAQRGVVSPGANLATAADVIALDGKLRLVVLELKCGYSGDRNAAAKHRGIAQKLKGPLKSASDCAYHRHLSQLAATRAMLLGEDSTLAQLREAGVKLKGPEAVRGVLLYIDDNGAEAVELEPWWGDRGGRIVSACA